MIIDCRLFCFLKVCFNGVVREVKNGGNKRKERENGLTFYLFYFYYLKLGRKTNS